MNLSKEGKTEVLAFFESGAVTWWKPDELWTGYPTAFSKLLPTDPFALDDPPEVLPSAINCTASTNLNDSQGIH
jgi:hypothetical protein